MKLLVTGGLGFIGSNFINYWLKHHQDDEITNIDKETYAANRKNIRYDLAHDNYRLVSGDICDKDLVNELVPQADAVINFAAESHVDNSISDPEPFMRTNYFGVYSLLEAARKHDVRFHQVSTDEVYGSLELDDERVFNSNSCYNPRNPYSASKAAADHLVRAYVNTYGIRATISNCSNNFGPNQHPEKLIPKTIFLASRDEKIPIYGNGANVRDWLFVEDHCKAIDAILKKGKIGRTYLISDNNQVSNRELVLKILAIMKKDQRLIKYIADRPGHDMRYALDSDETKKELGWKAEAVFDESLRKTVMHYSHL